MKKQFLILLAALLLLSGCGRLRDRAAALTEGSSKPEHQEHESSGKEETPVDENSLPGSWTVPDGWVMSEKYSTKDKLFYVEEGHEDDELPDNISIEVGKNRYSAEEHEKFREAILRQLLMQTQGMEAELTGDGTFTEQDYILYIFTITESDVVTKQYYIVGDQQYCLIHLTTFTDSDHGAEAAQAIADSFVWDNAED